MSVKILSYQAHDYQLYLVLVSRGHKTGLTIGCSAGFSPYCGTICSTGWNTV